MKKVKRLIFTAEEENIQKDAALKKVPHKITDPKTKKEKEKEKGKEFANISENDKEKAQAKNLQMEVKEYKLLNVQLTEEIRKLKEERRLAT